MIGNLNNIYIEMIISYKLKAIKDKCKRIDDRQTFTYNIIIYDKINVF